MIGTLYGMARRLLPRNPFARGVSVLVGGTAGSQLLMILAAPILTRLFTPDDFGVLAVYAGLLGVFIVVASLRYELAIPLPEDNQEAANVTVLSLASVAFVSAACALVVLGGNDAIPAMLGVPQLSHYFWLLPVGIFFAGIYQVFNYWALRNKEFPAIAGTRLKQSLTTVAMQLLGYKLGPAMLLAGHAAGQGMGGMSLGKGALRYAEFRKVRLAGVIAAARRYRQFPIYSTWAGLFNTSGVQLPALMFAAIFDPAAAGLYALTHRVLSTPMSVIGNAVANIFFANAADARRSGHLGGLVTAVHDKLANVAMPPATMLLVAGPHLFALAFGENWREAGVFAQWMTPWLYVTFITSPLSNLFDVLEKQNVELFFAALIFAVRIGAIALGGLIGDLMTTVALFSLGSLLCAIALLLGITRLAGNTAASLVKPTLTALAWSCACAAPLAIALWFAASSNSWVAALAVTVAMMSARFCFLFRRAY